MRTLLLSPVLVAVTIVGCSHATGPTQGGLLSSGYHYYSHEPVAPHWDGRRQRWIVADTPSGIDDSEPTLGDMTPITSPEQTYAAPRVTAPDPEHARFDASAARSAILAVDLAPCTAAGVPQGYGHAQATFANDGNVTHVLIDAPAGMPPEAAQCLGRRLATAKVGAFEGAPTTVGASFYVKGS
jgi:hypothetical protein